MTKRSGVFVSFFATLTAVLVISSPFLLVALAASNLYVNLSLIPFGSVERGGKINVLPLAVGSYPISCTAKNVTDNRVLGTFVYNNVDDTMPGYIITDVQSDKTVNLKCSDSAGKVEEDTHTVVVSDVGNSNFGVGQYASESVVAPGGKVTLKSSAYQGIFPYECTYSDSTGWRKQETITQGNKGPANPQSYEYIREITPQVTATYTTDCTDAAGLHDTASATVTVSSSPVLNLKIYGEDKLPGGGAAKIEAGISLASSCIHSDGTEAWRSEKYFNENIQGGVSTPYTVTQTTTFSLECKDASGKTSGKKSTTVYVGSNAKCGDGVIDEDSGEECDNGQNNSDSCPTTCSTACQELWLCNSPLKWEGKFNSSGGKMCPSKNGQTTDYYVLPGETVTYNWNADNVVSCSIDDRDQDIPWPSCFPGPRENYTANVPLSGSCQMTAPEMGNNPTLKVACRDSNGIRGDEQEEFYVIPDDRWIDTKGKVDCVNDTTEADITFEYVNVAPSRVSFGYSGDITFGWNVSAEPLDTGGSLECGVGEMVGSSGQHNTFQVWPGQSYLPTPSGQDMSTKIPVSVVLEHADGAEDYLYGTKEIYIGCRVITKSGHIMAEADSPIRLYFESDPSLAPVVKLTWGRPDADESQVVQITPVPGTAYKIYLQTGGAERCEFSRQPVGGSPYTKTYLPMKPGTEQQGIIFTPESMVDTNVVLTCFNGELSTQKTMLLQIKSGTTAPPDGGSGGGSGGWGGDGTCQSPNVCLSGGCAPDTYKPGPGTCTDSGLSCCTPLALPSPGIGYFNPLKYNSVDSVLTAILSTLQSIVVTLSIIMIIVGAVMYILSAGNESRVTQAKVAITAAMVGLALAIAAPAFLKEIGELLGWIEVTEVVDEAQSFTEIATKVLNFLLSIVGIIGIIMLVIGGLMYLTAGGDEGKAETGKKITTYAIIAIAIALSALVLVTQVAKFFG